MGYFSEQYLKAQENYTEQSCNEYEQLMMWRYEELENRYKELKASAPQYSCDYFSNDDYLYAPVECFKTVRDVRRAMEITAEEIKRSAVVEEKKAENAEDIKGDVLELVLLTTWYQTLKTA